ncbi:MAG: hypothetical protein ABSE67_01145 [Xanthobacteraceae bacterium]
MQDRGILLATGTLVAALILFIIQLPFELRASDSTDFFTAEYTISRAKPEIRQWKYDSDGGMRLNKEIDASRKFAEAHPGQFDGARDKLTQDMVVFSLLAYLGVEQFDWQVKRVRFVGQSAGAMTLMSPTSKPDECALVTKDQLHKMLFDAGNSFADGNIFLVLKPCAFRPRRDFG